MDIFLTGSRTYILQFNLEKGGSIGNSSNYRKPTTGPSNCVEQLLMLGKLGIREVRLQRLRGDLSETD
jgi:hypothetical protein